MVALKILLSLGLLVLGCQFLDPKPVSKSGLGLSLEQKSDLLEIQIVYKKLGVSLSLQQMQDVWLLKSGDKSVPAEPQRVADLIESLSSIIAQKTFSKAPDQDYGLLRPEVEVRLIGKNWNESWFIGSKLQVGFGSYFQRLGDEKIYVVSDALRLRLSRQQAFYVAATKL